MPWTRKQVKYLLSNGSPLKPEQKEKMKSELHSDPAMGHMKKGQFHGSAANYKHSRPKRKVVKRTY
jgi:hypothetical protein